MKNNITPTINSKIGKNLHNKINHPIEIIKRKIYNYFDENFQKFDEINPIVTIEDNFDKLLIPKDHPARSTSDTYYHDENHVLRTHTSAHQNKLLTDGHKNFLVTGDVYRKDDIDASHYPVFHQMEGVSVMDINQDVESELKKVLSGLIDVLFPGCEYRFNEDYFPFTSPSFEVEVMFHGKWLEVLGCGIIQPKILESCGLHDKKAWAFGLGLERLSMILFKIPDIRYFWTDDERFMNQFNSGDIIEFQPYSNYPTVTKDISFWVDETFSHNDFCEIAREIGGDLIENVSNIDNFTHPITQKISKCYKIVYRSNDRTLTNEEINEIQNTIRSGIVEKLKIELR